MKKVLLAVLLLSPFVASAAEVLVLTTATRVDSASSSYRRGIEIQNQGPNTIWCNASTSTVVATKARQVLPGEAWAINVRAGVPVYCLASTASQVTGAATVVTEAR